ncbi:MAG: glycosyltransferase family 39 protein [Bryobacteraceae bacterium]
MNRWMLFPLLAGLLALWLSHGFMRVPFVSNDGVQYLDAAEHLRSGQCLCTTVAHFDEQVARGSFPVPFTHFAPGYPILVAGISFLGFAPDIAGYMISALAFLVTLWATWDMGLRLGAGPVAMVLISLLWLTSDLALSYAAQVQADAALTAVLCVTAALVVRDVQSDGSGRFGLVAIGIAAALSYWMKYAGLFVIPVAILYLLWRAWRTTESRLWAVGGIAAALLLAAPIPVHNIINEGSWRGGFQSGHHHTLRFAIVETVKSIYHLIFGANAPARFDALALIAVLSLLAVFVLAARSRSPRPFTALFWMAMFIAAFLSGVALASMQTIASDMLRYNLPVYPLLLVAGAVVLMPRQRVELAAFSIFILAALVIQSRSVLPASVSRPDAERAILAQQPEPGVSMRRWLETHVAASETIVAVNGQALHYIVKRPVVALIDPAFSDRQTDDAAFAALMKRFHARYLVVYPNLSADAVPEQQAIPFLSNLASGVAPSWLQLAARTENVAVFACADCR